jgi:biotin operon repressor
MPLKLNDLLTKAEKKGITKQNPPPSSTPIQLLRPWQQESILYVSDDKKLEPNLSQTKAKLEPNYSQTTAKLEPCITSKKEKVEPKVKSNSSQTTAKLEPKLPFSSLVGLQRKITLFIHEICQTILEQQTNPLSIEFIATRCQSPKSAIRKAIQRLEQKGILIRVAFKNGRGGWTQYQLLNQIYQEILMLKNQKSEPNLSQT